MVFLPEYFGTIDELFESSDDTLALRASTDVKDNRRPRGGREWLDKRTRAHSRRPAAWRVGISYSRHFLDVPMTHAIDTRTSHRNDISLIAFLCWCRCLFNRFCWQFTCLLILHLVTVLASHDKQTDGHDDIFARHWISASVCARHETNSITNNPGDATAPRCSCFLSTQLLLRKQFFVTLVKKLQLYEYSLLRKIFFA